MEGMSEHAMLISLHLSLSVQHQIFEATANVALPKMLLL